MHGARWLLSTRAVSAQPSTDGVVPAVNIFTVGAGPTVVGGAKSWPKLLVPVMIGDNTTPDTITATVLLDLSATGRELGWPTVSSIRIATVLHPGGNSEVLPPPTLRGDAWELAVPLREGCGLVSLELE